MNTTSGNSLCTELDDTMNEDTSVVVATAATVTATTHVVDMTVTTTAGNDPSKSSYANITGKPSRKKLNVHILFTPGGNGIDVAILVDSIRAISERFANTAYGFFLGKNMAYPIVATYVRNTWGKYGLIRSMFSSSTELFSFQFSSMDGLDAMLENGPSFIQNNLLVLKKWHPDENLLKEDVSSVLVWVKLHGVHVTAFSEDGLNAIATKLGAGEKKTMKKPNQTSRCVQSTASSSGNKKKGVEPTIEANSSGSSFMNVDNSSSGTTPIINKIRKFEDLLTSGQAILVDKAGNPLKKLKFLGEYDSEDEVASVDNDKARSMASEKPLIEVEGFCFWETRFVTYIKSKDIDLWQVIQNGDFVFMIIDPKTKMKVETPYELLKDDQKKQLSKSNKANMTLYNALPQAKELASLPLNELIDNLKVYEIILENDGVASKTTKEKVKSLAFKAKVTREQTNNDIDSQGVSDKDVDEEEAKEFNLMARNFHKFFRKGNRFERGNHFDNDANRFGRGDGNGFGNKGGESLRQRRGCYN
ncbi:retrovirus-related pol polyprotein from transposon TNT 1-94 [Tanacetum coccineum]|uniref:Retrovirus-related pol polyprotein from transposon TNT 1-94 n=1 Tax=Tanacetum coccineum TaxID=301880 RepID=A0ABQ5EYD7_9ASTR